MYKNTIGYSTLYYLAVSESLQWLTQSLSFLFSLRKEKKLFKKT